MVIVSYFINSIRCSYIKSRDFKTRFPENLGGNQKNLIPYLHLIFSRGITRCPILRVTRPVYIGWRGEIAKQLEKLARSG